MEQLDVLLLLMRTIAMTFFLVEALHLFVYARHSHIYRLYGVLLLAMGAMYALTIYSSYFSDYPILYGGQLNLLWNLIIPTIIVLCYEILMARRMKMRYVLAHNLPFLFAFLFYSVNNNQTLLYVIAWLSLGYATISVIVIQVMTVKEMRRHEVKHEKHAYGWFAVMMWAMYATLLIRVVMYDVDMRLAKIIAMIVLILVYAILTLLLRRGILDFHILHRELPNEDEQMVLPTIPSPVLPQPQVRPAKLSVRDSSVDQPFHMHDQVSFFGDKARQLTDLMETKRLYLQPDLSVATLAMELGTNRTYLSNLINQYLHTTFTNYVNAYRVQYAKNLLLKTDDTIEEIFQAAGFQSRTTFWRAFAQVEGCTPKDFRKKAVKNTPPAKDYVKKKK